MFGMGVALVGLLACDVLDLDTWARQRSAI